MSEAGESDKRSASLDDEDEPNDESLNFQALRRRPFLRRLRRYWLWLHRFGIQYWRGAGKRQPSSSINDESGYYLFLSFPKENTFKSNWNGLFFEGLTLRYFCGGPNGIVPSNCMAGPFFQILAKAGKFVAILSSS